MCWSAGLAWYNNDHAWSSSKLVVNTLDDEFWEDIIRTRKAWQASYKTKRWNWRPRPTRPFPLGWTTACWTTAWSPYEVATSTGQAPWQTWWSPSLALRSLHFAEVELSRRGWSPLKKFPRTVKSRIIGIAAIPGPPLPRMVPLLPCCSARVLRLTSGPGRMKLSSQP